jgi:hypothetical protein
MKPTDPSGEDPVEPEEVEEQEAVQVPDRDALSVITTEPTGSVHGDAETPERVGEPDPVADR